VLLALLAALQLDVVLVVPHFEVDSLADAVASKPAAVRPAATSVVARTTLLVTARPRP